MSKEQNRIPVLQRAVEVMEYIASHPGRVSQPELIAALKIPQATCYRIIATLVAAKWLVKFQGNKYDIAPGIRHLSRKTDLLLEKYRPLQGALEHLARQAGFSVKLSVLSGEEHVNVLSAKAPWDIALTAESGTRFELKNGGSVAIIFLSGMPEKQRSFLVKQTADPEKTNRLIREFEKNGYALNLGSPDLPIEAMSVAIRGHNEEEIIGVLTLLCMPGELAKADLPLLLQKMHKTVGFCGDFMQCPTTKTGADHV